MQVSVRELKTHLSPYLQQTDATWSGRKPADASLIASHAPPKPV